MHHNQARQSTTYVGELALDCGDTGSIGDISKADFVAIGSICVAGIAACSNDWTSSALAKKHTHTHIRGDSETVHMQLHRDKKVKVRVLNKVQISEQSQCVELS